eukprot:scaffold89453_cov40-Cyclotella_meneghiniana.AAC.1
MTRWDTHIMIAIMTSCLTALSVVHAFTSPPTFTCAYILTTRSSSKLHIMLTGIDDTILTRSQALAYPLGFLAAFRTGAAISVINQPRMPPIDGAVGSSVWRLPSSGARVKLFYPVNDNENRQRIMAPY